MVQEAVLILPTQLFQEHPLLKTKTLVLLVECERYFSDFKFHKQKLILHRATLRMYHDYLVDAGHTVVYIDFPAMQKLEDELIKRNIKQVHYCDPVDVPLQHELEKRMRVCGITLQTYDTPLFLTSRDVVKEYFSTKTSFRQHHFYQFQRKRLQILLTPEGDPVGGMWSFDTENRQAFSGASAESKRYKPHHDAYYKEAYAYVQQHFPDNYGSVEHFWYPVTFVTAKKWLQDFLQHRFAQFGPYQDAIVHDEPILFHSVLSPLLNIGLLTPAYVLEQALAYADKHKVPLQSLEGFVRQLIGWREYVRGIYVTVGEKERASNFFGHTATLPEAYWLATTGIDPIDDAIKQALDYAYTHHIVRLMVLGTSMLLRQVHPDEVYRWFMELFIDAYDWVMVPNVYGMSQYADGGLITTKPYICGSNYILRMSDYTKGVWAGTWDSLYWYFVYKHRAVLAKNHRLALMASSIKRMSPEMLRAHIATAQAYLEES
jgi:deoxyribodipyrimidine photolyase-related protein